MDQPRQNSGNSSSVIIAMETGSTNILCRIQRSAWGAITYYVVADDVIKSVC